MFCTRCGSELNDDAAFCTNCGNKMQTGSPASDVASAGMRITHARQASASNQGSLGDLIKSNKALVGGIVAAAIVLIVALGVIVFLLIAPSSTETSTSYQSIQHSAASSASSASSQSEQSSSSSSSSSTSSAATEASVAAEYMMPDSDSRYYTAADLSALSDWDLYIGRNEIFAKYGRGFKNADLAQYFGSKSWYQQLYTPEQFDAMPSPLNDFELKNLDVIRAEEKRRNSQYAV